MDLKIIEINNKNYTLKSQDGTIHKLNLTFFDIPEAPKVGNEIEIKDQLLDEKYVEYSHAYIFGGLNMPYGRRIKQVEDIDCIKLVMGNKIYYLKRFFG